MTMNPLKTKDLQTPRSRVLPEKLTGPQLDKIFTTLQGTWRFITAFTTIRQLSLSWARSIPSMPPNPTWRSILISSHLRLGLPSCLFPSGFPTKTRHPPRLSPIRAACPACLILHLITGIVFGEQYGSLSSPLCSLLHSSVTLSLLGTSIFLSTLFSYTLNLHVPPSVWQTKCHTHTKQQAKLHFCESWSLCF